MHQSPLRVLGFICILLGLAQIASAANNVYFCDGNGDGFKECVCIAWSTPQGEALEIRCPNGSGSPSGAVPPTFVPPTWGGIGTPQSPSASPPGMPLLNPTLANVEQANRGAASRAKGEYDASTGFRLPDECTSLFHGSRLGKSGYALLSSYIQYRSGVGVKDASGNVPCNGTRLAWTKCCAHDPYVFICNEKFNELSPSERMYTLIHEALHVAGQLENGSGTVTGPGDPPNPAQLDDAVRKACS